MNDFDALVRQAVYRHVVDTTRAPDVEEMAAAVGADRSAIREAYARLRSRRLLVLAADGETIVMAPPFSGIPTQHRVRAGGKEYAANCSWDALGIAAALHAEAVVHSRCEQSGERLIIPIGASGPEPVPCVAHFAVPAARWWADIVYT